MEKELNCILSVKLVANHINGLRHCKKVNNQMFSGNEAMVYELETVIDYPFLNKRSRLIKFGWRNLLMNVAFKR